VGTEEKAESKAPRVLKMEETQQMSKWLAMSDFHKEFLKSW
jgi:hypothetical protein